MKTKLPEKWIEATAIDRPARVVVRTMKNRFGAILKLLPAAAKSRKDVEHVHQLRVWTRRTVTALNLYEELLPRRGYAWMKKQLKRIRRAANGARDCDVLMAWLQNDPSTRGTKRWLKDVRAERHTAQKSIVAVYRRLLHGRRFKRRIDRLLRHVHGQSEVCSAATSTQFGDWSRERLGIVVVQFFAAIPPDQHDARALHRFRICGKELRYALELLAGALPETLRTEVYPILESLADRLGEINDLATAMAWLQQALDPPTTSRRTSLWQDLLSDRQTEFDRARREFWDWWTPQMQQDLRDRFAILLDAQVQSPYESPD